LLQRAVEAQLDPLTGYGEHAPGRQANDGIAAPFLASLHRLEQVGVRTFGKLEVGAERRVEISEDLAHQRNAVVTLGCEGVELGLIHDSPSVGRKGKNALTNQVSAT